jgi:hypothetical protein
MNPPDFKATRPICWDEEGELPSFVEYVSKIRSHYAMLELELSITLGDQMLGAEGLSRCPDIHLKIYMHSLRFQMSSTYLSISQAMEALECEFLPYARDHARIMAEDILALVGS